jgi:hypothetical protein
MFVEAFPIESKTGTGPTLLTCVRDWLNERPFRNEANARLICNLLTGAPIKPDSLCTIMTWILELPSLLIASWSYMVFTSVLLYAAKNYGMTSGGYKNKS